LNRSNQVVNMYPTYGPIARKYHAILAALQASVHTSPWTVDGGNPQYESPRSKDLFHE
jgi:hypothetical protein